MGWWFLSQTECSPVPVHFPPGVNIKADLQPCLCLVSAINLAESRNPSHNEHWAQSTGKFSCATLTGRDRSTQCSWAAPVLVGGSLAQENFSMNCVSSDQICSFALFEGLSIYEQVCATDIWLMKMSGCVCICIAIHIVLSGYYVGMNMCIGKRVPLYRNS